MVESNAPAKTADTSLTGYFAEKYGVDRGKLYTALSKVCFVQSDGSAPSNEQMMTLLIVAKQYDLNPFTREICALPVKGGRIIPYVTIDGWLRLMTRQPNYDGFAYAESSDLITVAGGLNPVPEWGEVTIWHKDRSHPTVVREYFTEVWRPQVLDKNRIRPDSPWAKQPRRMLRHKVMMQGIRLAFGFGLYDFDDALTSAQNDEESVTDISSVDTRQTAEPVLQIAAAQPDLPVRTQPAQIAPAKPAARRKDVPNLADKAKFDQLLTKLAEGVHAAGADEVTREARLKVLSNWQGEDRRYAEQFVQRYLAAKTAEAEAQAQFITAECGVGESASPFAEIPAEYSEAAL